MSEFYLHNTPLTSGSIEVICGSMFSGKTAELIHRVNGVTAAKKSILVFKPSLDVRYSKTEVVSHNKLSVPAIAVVLATEILPLAKNADIVAVDEVQFFDVSIVSVCKQLAKENKRVIVAGLDTNYLGEPFGYVPQLLAVADYITKLHAICNQCGNLANFTHRKEHNENLILLGENDKYAALCRSCFNAK